MTSNAAPALALGIALGVGLWSIVAALPRFGRQSLAARIAPALLDLSSRAAEDVAARRRRAPSVLALFGPSRERVERLLARWSGGGDALAARLRSAGLTVGVDEYRSRQILWALGGGAAGALVVAVSMSLHPMPVALRWSPPVFGAVAGVMARDRVLRWEARTRRQRIVDELPTILDFLALCLSAGEGIRDVLERVARTGTGEFSRELGEVAGQARTGVPLAQALRDLERRLRVPALSRCVDAIVAALEHGSPLAAVLRAQANDVRDEAKRVLLESAGRKEIAMMVPLVFLILPVTVLFAVYPGVFVLRSGF